MKRYGGIIIRPMRRRYQSRDSEKFDNRIPMSKNTNAEDDSYKDQQIPKYTGREKKKIRNSKWNDDEENDYYLTLLLNILLNKEKMVEQEESGSGSYNL